MITAINFSSLKKIFLTAGFISLLTVSGMVFTPADALARQPGPGTPPPSFPNKPMQEVPIDGGLTLLAAAGGGYAIKKLRDKKK